MEEYERTHHTPAQDDTVLYATVMHPGRLAHLFWSHPLYATDHVQIP